MKKTNPPSGGKRAGGKKKTLKRGGKKKGTGPPPLLKNFKKKGTSPNKTFPGPEKLKWIFGGAEKAVPQGRRKIARPKKVLLKTHHPTRGTRVVEKVLEKTRPL